jgi:hypothetical protein
MELFHPDTLLPEQYFAEYSRNPGSLRERHLMLAVLRDAVECYQKFALARDPRGRVLFGAWTPGASGKWSAGSRGGASPAAAHAISVLVSGDPERVTKTVPTIEFPAFEAQVN